MTLAEQVIPVTRRRLVRLGPGADSGNPDAGGNGGEVLRPSG
jgi:hypothetical protein